MSRPFVTAGALFLLPVVVFAGGVWVMSAISGRESVDGQKPLNQRFGYDVAAVDRYWGALDKPARRAEQRFLELDLVFPVWYGMALAASLVIASALASAPVHAAWLILPVVVTVVADWVENLVQLEQLRNYIEAGKNDLAAGWIHAASAATIVKLIFFWISSFALLALLAMLILKARAAH